MMMKMMTMKWRMMELNTVRNHWGGVKTNKQKSIKGTIKQKRLYV